MSADNITPCPRCRAEAEDGTLREYYYAIGVDEEGVFEVDFHAFCRDCGWEYTFQYKEVAYDPSVDN